VPHLLHQDYTMLFGVIRNRRVILIHSRYHGLNTHPGVRIFEVAITVDALKLRNTIQLVGILCESYSCYCIKHLLTGAASIPRWHDRHVLPPNIPVTNRYRDTEGTLL
jgi:hypothetical protein